MRPETIWEDVGHKPLIVSADGPIKASVCINELVALLRSWLRRPINRTKLVSTLGGGQISATTNVTCVSCGVVNNRGRTRG